jgi:hypothetical protein
VHKKLQFDEKNEFCFDVQLHNGVTIVNNNELYILKCILEIVLTQRNDKYLRLWRSYITSCIHVNIHFTP